MSKEISKKLLIIICYNCGEDCFNNQYPEIIFKDDDRCICENCSIDYEEINGKIEYRS